MGLTTGSRDDPAELEPDPQEVNWLQGDSVEKDRLNDLLAGKDELTDFLAEELLSDLLEDELVAQSTRSLVSVDLLIVLKRPLLDRASHSDFSKNQ